MHPYQTIEIGISVVIREIYSLVEPARLSVNLWPGHYARMNGYSALLPNIAPGKYIVIKVEYELQLHFKIFLNKSDRKQQQK